MKEKTKQVILAKESLKTDGDTGERRARVDYTLDELHRLDEDGWKDDQRQRSETNWTMLSNQAGYTAQDAPSIRTFHLRK